MLFASLDYTVCSFVFEAIQRCAVFFLVQGSGSSYTNIRTFHWVVVVNICVRLSFANTVILVASIMNFLSGSL
jgi:hypothetical protein